MLSNSIQTYSPEQELQEYSKNGEWELVLQSTAFQKRSKESQVELFRQSIDNRIKLLRQSFSLMINKGPSHRSTAMNIMTQIKKLESMRDDAIANSYVDSSLAQQLPQEAGVKIEYY